MIVPVSGVITLASGVAGSQKSVLSLNSLTPGWLGMTEATPLTCRVMPYLLINPALVCLTLRSIIAILNLEFEIRSDFAAYQEGKSEEFRFNV